MAYISGLLNYSGWRQHQKNYKKIKSLCLKISRLKHSSSKDEEKKKVRAKRIEQVYKTYMEVSKEYIEKSKKTIKDFMEGEISNSNLSTVEHVALYVKIEETEEFIKDAERQIDQIERRIIKGEKIPHDEKLFSIFEKHTEWISKGKSGVPQELGAQSVYR